MFDHSTPRVATRVAILALAILLVGSMVAVAPAAADSGALAQEDETDDDVPTQADMVRITPDNPDKEYLKIETQETDEQYNTTGPYATFSLSEPVESARLEQPNADVRVLGDGSVVRIEYEPEAAGDDGSLYTAELFFEDGSTHSIDLYAYQTDVSLEASKYAEYSPVIDYLEGQATAEGYEETPDGVQSYIEDTEERAELFDHLFTEHVMMFLSLLMMAARNFVSWVVVLAIIAGLAVYLERKHGWVLRLQQYIESRGEIIRETVRQDYEERRNTAAKHPLEDVDEIGPNAARYWREVGIETVDDMVEIACKGIVKTNREGKIEFDDDGNQIFAHHGVDDLKEVDPLTVERLREQTWLSPLILEGRLAATTALSNIESALLVAEKEYNRGNEVRDARRTVEELIARLNGERDHEGVETSSNAARPDPRTDFGGTPAGGD